MLHRRPAYRLTLALALLLGGVSLPSVRGDDGSTAGVTSGVEADGAPQAMTRLSVSQWIRPAVRGEFRARVIQPLPAGGARVIPDAIVTLRRDGIRYRARTDARGELHVVGIPPGAYAMSAQGAGLSAFYSMHLLDPEGPNSHPYPAIAEIPCAPEAASTFIRTVRLFEPTEYDIDRISIDEEKVAPLPSSDATLKPFRVSRTDGGLAGRLFQAGDHGVAWDDDDEQYRLDPADRMTVFLFRGGKRIRRDMSNNLGEFRFERLELGLYTLTAVGRHGLATVGFELIDDDPTADSTTEMPRADDGRRYVQQAVEVLPPPDEIPFIDDCCGCDFAIQVSPVCGEPCEPNPCQDECSLPCEEGFVDSFAGLAPMGGGGDLGGGGGGGFAAGGGGFGGSGGSLAAIAAIGAVAATSSSNDPPTSDPPGSVPPSSEPPGSPPPVVSDEPFDDPDPASADIIIIP